MHGKPGLNKRPHARLPFSFLDMNALMTSTEHSFESQATLVIYVAYFSDKLSMGVCTTRHLQTSGRPVQELNVCSVAP